MLKNISYYTAGSNKRIAELKFTDDSLFFIDKTPAGDKKIWEYSIVSEQQKGAYIFVYIEKVKRTPIPVAGRTLQHRQPLPYGVLVFQLSKSKNNLLVLHEDKRWFSSLADAQNSSIENKLEEKYFETWYSKAAFDKAVSYQDIASANKETMQTVTNNWVSEMKRNQLKFQNSQKLDVYGSGYGKDNLTKVLIHAHLNPLTTLSDFYKKDASLQIVIPHLPATKHNEPTTLLKADSQNVIIDEPAIKH